MTTLRTINSHIALRGIAALLVVLYHLQYGARQRLPIEEVTPFFRRGYLWVDLFFVLSGFIICYANHAERLTPMSKDEKRYFLIGRVIRLYPLHIVCLTAYVLTAALITGLFFVRGSESPFSWNAHSLFTIAAQAVLLNAWFPDLNGWNVPSWSISAEIVAYGLFPWLMGFHVRWRIASEAVMLGASAAFLIAIAMSSGDLDIIGGLMAPIRCVAGFMLGMLIYFHRDRIAGIASTWLTMLQIIAVIGIGFLLAHGINDPLIVPFFVILVATTWTDRGLLPLLLVHRPAIWLGNISYSVYLVHVPVLRVRTHWS